MNLSTRVQAIKPSPTLAVTARAARLKAEGKDIIGLGAGEPDFDTPQHIKNAAIDAINKGFTKYTAVGGTPGLKKAIVDKFKRENNFEYNPGQILVSCGGKQSFFNLALAALNPGDEVIIPAPYWVSYPDIVMIAEGRPVFIDTGIEQGFKIDAQQLEEAITAKTRMFVINSPSNPSGAVYTLDELKALGDVLKKYPQILIATDDMYEHILLSGKPFINILNACPELYPRTVVLNGVSKAYSMTGWRIGWTLGPVDVTTAMSDLQSQQTSNPCSISQYASLAALNGPQECLGEMLEKFAERRRYVLDRLNKIPGLSFATPGGAFYAFFDVSSYFGKPLQGGTVVDNASDFCTALLEVAHVALVTGDAFGAPGYVRLSFATSLDVLEAGLNRLEAFLAGDQ